MVRNVRSDRRKHLLWILQLDLGKVVATQSPVLTGKIEFHEESLPCSAVVEVMFRRVLGCNRSSEVRAIIWDRAHSPHLCFPDQITCILDSIESLACLAERNQRFQVTCLHDLEDQFVGQAAQHRGHVHGGFGSDSSSTIYVNKQILDQPIHKVFVILNDRYRALTFCSYTKMITCRLFTDPYFEHVSGSTLDHSLHTVIHMRGERTFRRGLRRRRRQRKNQ